MLNYEAINNYVLKQINLELKSKGKSGMVSHLFIDSTNIYQVPTMHQASC